VQNWWFMPSAPTNRSRRMPSSALACCVQALRYRLTRGAGNGSTREMSENQPSHKNPAIGRLLRDESEHQLWSQLILGYPVYPLLRLNHYRRAVLELAGTTLKERSFREHTPHMSARIKTSVVTATEGLLSRFPKRDIWVLSASNYRRRNEAGVLENIFTQHLQEQLGDRVLYLEKNLVNLSAQHREDLLFVDALHWAALSAGKLSANATQFAIPSEVAKTFAPTGRRRLAALAIYGTVLERVYTALIERHRPKAVFVLNSYSEFVPAQRAIKRANIPLIELQHGIIHHSHPGYAYPDTPALAHAPDHIVTFGTRFGQILEETASYWKGRWSVGGHGWLQNRAQKASTSTTNSRVVLFSQPEPDVQRQVDDLAAQVRLLLSPDVEVFLKPHPNERNTESVYARAIAAGVRLAHSIDDSYSLLAQCSVAVSVYSTVALEALAFPCISAVVRSPRWTEEIHAFVQLGQLKPVDSAADIKSLTAASNERRDVHGAGRALFGIGEPVPDFERLVAEVDGGTVASASVR
jgi:hypothetical protein